MINPVHHLGHAIRLRPRGDHGTVDHDHRQVQGTRGLDFGIGPGAAGILGHHQINAVLRHQRAVIRGGERPARHQHMVIGKGRRDLGRVNEAQQIEMLRIGREVLQMHPPYGQHHAGRWSVQCAHGTGNIGHVGPIIARLSAPRCADQRDQGYARLRTGLHRIAAHLGGKRVGRIDHMSDLFCAHIRHQPLHTAKAAHPLRQWLPLWARHAPGKAHNAAQPHLCGSIGKGRRLKRAPEDQEVRLHV
mmetsp:Transcript_29006/g.55661  ORF Transcript_29006/g.55661 Transcript_29006/m.55661 type:complete len:246 (+) Transcript_29006:2163-2900(+)